MSAICPQGHTSQAEDYCDTCGSPIATAAPAAPTPAEPDPAAAGPTRCPHCDAPAAPRALFCENCGYDFTTGTAPQPVAADPWALPGDPGEQQPSQPTPAPEPEPEPEPSAGEAETETDPAAADPQEGDPGEGDPDEGDQPTAGSALPTPPVPGPDSWVAEVWVDPDWYAAQNPEDPMPAPGSPHVVRLREKSVLVGRPSASRGIRPDIDAGEDTGVSRRHCQLSTDGLRWWVEDLDSANGTYVSPPGDPLPTTPLTPGQRHELVDDERIFVGGWTRIVVRIALPGEV